jgi:hypothetical protein
MSGYDGGGDGTYGYVVGENPFGKMALDLFSSFTSYQIQFHGFPANQRVSQIPRNKILFPVRLNPTINPFEGFSGRLGINPTQDDQSFGYGNLDLDDTAHQMCDDTRDESRIRTLNKIRNQTRDDTHNKSMKSLADYFKN